MASHYRLPSSRFLTATKWPGHGKSGRTTFWTRLTLEAVTIEAGIGKAGVIYDFETKQALLNAIVERRVVEEEAGIQTASEAARPGPNRHMKAHIQATHDSRADRAQASVVIRPCAARRPSARCATIASEAD